jgi:hypothetical protein
MRILIISSCTGKKENLDKPLPASELYRGQQHLRLMRGIQNFRKHKTNAIIDLFIVSAGHGIVFENYLMKPYERTFSGQKKKDLYDLAKTLNIPNAFRKIIEKPYDLGLFLLGADYLEACQIDEDIKLGGPTIAFMGTAAKEKLPSLPGLIPVLMGQQEAKQFSCGLVSLKGEMATRLLQDLIGQKITLSQITKPNADILSMLAPATLPFG